MSKLKKIIMIGILMLIGYSSTACNWECDGKSYMIMSEDGKGTFSTSIYIYKDFFSEKYYSKVNGIDDYIAKLKSETDKDIDLKYTVDKDKREYFDYITVSFEYSSIKEFDEKIKKLDERAINLYNTTDTSYLSSDVFDAYNNYKHTLDIEFQKYLTDNGITFNPKGKNYKKILENVYRCTDHRQKEHKGKRYLNHNKSVIDNYVKIEKKGTESILTIKPNAIFAFNNYIGEINYLLGQDIFDTEKMNTALSEYVYEEEIKYIYEFLNMVKISKELKLAMDKDKKIKGYDIDKYSAKIFDDEKFSDEYQGELDYYINDYGQDDDEFDYDPMDQLNEDPRDRLETLYSVLLLGLDGNMVNMVNIKYGDNSYELEEYLLNYTDNLAISSVKGKKVVRTWKKEVIEEYSNDNSDTDNNINDSKEKNNTQNKKTHKVSLDEIPKTGDYYDVPLIIGLAGLSLIGLIRLIRYIREN